jgi:hypothetical protein
MAKKESFKHPHLLICEGTDAKLFLIWLLKYLVDREEIRDDNFQADDFGGITELQVYLQALPRLPGFKDDTNTVRSITIIRDAETDANAASESVKTALRNCRFAVPNTPCEVASPSATDYRVNVAFALFPDFNKLTAGTLEDLCLGTLAGPNSGSVLGIADGAISSAVKKTVIFTREHKNRLHTYLSLTNEYVGLKIGESANAGAFDFSAENLKPLKDLLKNILL